MERYRKVLHAKIHRATVTHADLEYEGSVTIPPELLRSADIGEYEAVAVWNVTRGTRLETYAIVGEAGSTDICINGAAAHLVKPGDVVIIAAFHHLEEVAVKSHRPRVVFVDAQNREIARGREVPGPARSWRIQGNSVG